jgi:hypothetical protein
MPLEDELTHLLKSKVPSARDCLLVQRVLGWDGQRGCCLKDAGDEFGITRERARQIYDQAIERIRTAEISPVLDQALLFVNRMANRAADDIEAELLRRRFTGSPFAIRALLKTAQVFGRSAGFVLEQVGGKLFVVAGAGVVPSIVKAALRSSSRCGVQNVSALRSAIPRGHRRRNDHLLVRQVLNTRSDIHWLDAEEKIFWLASVPRNPLVRCLKKVIHYASPVALSDLHRAIGRLPAKQRTTLSRPVFIKFCAQVPFCRVANGYVYRAAPLGAGKLISHAERLVCQILRRHGNELSVRRLQDLCVVAGVPKPNLWRILLYSPLISRRAPRTYSVITAMSNSPETIKPRSA